ncbi:MAG: hypothetical protein ACFFEF_07490 [Candidatus Thorarchaeota archaeon]
MSPTKTDRIHYFTIESQNFPNESDFEPIGGIEKVVEYTIDEDDYTIGIYRFKEAKMNPSVGMIVPNKHNREKYFRRAVMGFFAGIIWMIVIGLTLVAWVIAVMLAGFGSSFLLAIMEPIGPFLLPIFGITTILCGIPIVAIIFQFPVYNRRIAIKGFAKLREITGSQEGKFTYKEITLHVPVYDMSISKKIPEAFRSEIQDMLAALDIADGIDVVAYTLVDRP